MYAAAQSEKEVKITLFFVASGYNVLPRDLILVILILASVIKSFDSLRMQL